MPAPTPMPALAPTDNPELPWSAPAEAEFVGATAASDDDAKAHSILGWTSSPWYFPATFDAFSKVAFSVLKVWPERLVCPVIANAWLYALMDKLSNQPTDRQSAVSLRR